MAAWRKRAIARGERLAAGQGAAPKPPVVPLSCPSCDAPVPLGEGETATCAFCRAVVPLPAAYRALRDAERQRTNDRDRAQALYRELGRPPSAALRAWSHLVTFAGGALVAVVAVLLSISTLFMLLAGFGLELVLHALAGPLGIDLIDRYGGGTVYASFAAGVLVLGVLPVWLTGYLDALAQIKSTLQVNLAAVPPQKPGFPSTCRGCGAALDVPAGAFGVRCAYCQSDNLVSLPASWIATVGGKQATFHRSIVTAVEQASQVRAEARAGVPDATKWGAVAIVVFGLVGRGCSALDAEGIGATFAQSMTAPRQMFSYWTPGEGVAIDRMSPFKHLPYTVALRRHEVLVWSSNDEKWDGRIDVKNTSSFPLLTKSWQQPWRSRTDGTYAATFTAPYTGLFVVELHTSAPTEGGTHLRWHVGN